MAKEFEIKCPVCEKNDLGTSGQRKRADGTLMVRFECKSCGKKFSVPHTTDLDKLLERLKASMKNLLCPICGKNDQVHKRGVKRGIQRYRCNRDGIVFNKDTKIKHEKKPNPACIWCGGPTIKAGENKQGVKKFFCKTDGSKFLDPTHPDAQKLRVQKETCPKCGSKNTHRLRITPKGRAEFYCHKHKGNFTKHYIKCIHCGSEKTYIRTRRNTFDVYKCKNKKCGRLFHNLELDDEVILNKLSNNYGTYKSLAIQLKERLSVSNDLLTTYKKFICDTGQHRKMYLWNRNQKKRKSKRAVTDLRVDIIQSDAHNQGKIILLIVSTDDELLIYDGDEYKIIREFLKYLKDLKRFRIYTLGYNLKNILETRASLYGTIKIPNITNKGAKFKGSIDLSYWLQDKSSKYRSRMRELAKELNIFPINTQQQVEAESKEIAELKARIDQAKQIRKIRLTKDQINDLFDGTDSGKRNFLLSSNIRIIDAIYYAKKHVEEYK